MAKLYSYRNVTHNGSPRACALTEAQVEAKLAEVRAANPGVVFERVEVKVVTRSERVWLQGHGRAGNSYQAVVQRKTIVEVK